MKDYALTCVISVEPEIRDYQTYEAQNFGEAYSMALTHLAHIAHQVEAGVRIVCLKEIEAVDRYETTEEPPSLVQAIKAYDDYVARQEDKGA